MEIVVLVLGCLFCGLGWAMLVLLATFAAGALASFLRKRIPLLNALPNLDANHGAVVFVFCAASAVTTCGVVFALRDVIPHRSCDIEILRSLLQMFAISIGLPAGSFVSRLFVKP